MAFDHDPDDDKLDDDAAGTVEALDDDYETSLAYDAQDDGEPGQDGAGDDEDYAEGDDSDPDEPRRHGKPQANTGQAWEIILAERNEAGEWHTVGEPVPDVDFMEQALAYDFAERENKRRFGRGFDWANDPGRAWVAVRVGTRGRL